MPPLAAIAPFGFTFDPVRFMAAYRSLGAATAQFYRNETNPPSVALALRSAASAGLRFDSIHGVFGEHIDPSGPDAGHRDECLRIYEDEGRLARDLGGPMVVVHPSGWNPNRREMPPKEAAEAAKPRRPILDTWLRRLADVGNRLDVVYLIENQPYNCPLGHDAADLAAQIAAVGSPHIRMCLDTGHAHITGDLAASVTAAAPVLSYIHIHDNDKHLDNHLMPGDGNIDWPAFSKALAATGSQATPMLEVFEEESKVEQRSKAGFGAQLRSWCGAE